MSGRFESIAEGAGGAKLLQRRVIGDERGFLSRLFEPEELVAFGWSGGVAQVNISASAQMGTLRGCHFQRPPFAETKLVTCVAGAIFDVAVDLRAGSPTFLQHFGAELSAANGRSLLIPEGFGHAFQTLSDDVRMIYVHSAPYSAEAEGAINCRDPRLGIDWPMPVSLISERDNSLPMMCEDYQGIVL